MQTLYNSAAYTVVAFERVAPDAADQSAGHGGGFEIVDKFSGKGIFIQGAVADSFQQGVQALVAQGPDEEALDDYIAAYTLLAQQPVLLH